jgi:hypothetical protein
VVSLRAGSFAPGSFGLAAVRFWTRQKFKETNALRGKLNATRISIEQKESVRSLENLTRSAHQLGDPSPCIHISDREADIYELFCAACKRVPTSWFARAWTGWPAGVARQSPGGWPASPSGGAHEVEVRDDHGRVSTARVFLRFCRMLVHSPDGKQKRYPPLSLTVIHAHERGMSEGREPIRWNLLSDLPVEDLAAAVEKLDAGKGASADQKRGHPG